MSMNMKNILTVHFLLKGVKNENCSLRISSQSNPENKKYLVKIHMVTSILFVKNTDSLILLRLN